MILGRLKRNSMEELDLEYKIIGEGKNTIVIETGIGCSFYNWNSLIGSIKDEFTVILYHRAGYGKSIASNSPRTTRNIAKELNELLDKIGLQEKFIFMGHSFGGLCVQQYAKMYPCKLKGIILIDSTSPNFRQLFMLNTPVMSSFIGLEKRIACNINSSKKSKEELENENKDMIIEYRNHICDNEISDFEKFHANPTLYKTMAEEFENWDIDSLDIKSISELANIPLVVIARDNRIAEEYWISDGVPEKEAIMYETEWRKLQIELSKLSIQGKILVAENSGHEVYIDRPDIIAQGLKSICK